jgi:hypothetical protein
LPRKHFDYGIIVPWIPLAAVLLLISWMISPGMLVYSMLPVFKTYAVTAIATAVLCLLVARDAGSRDLSIGDMKTEGTLTPLQWFAGILIGWPVMFPAFLHSYYSNTKPRRMHTGRINTGIFLISLLLLWIIVSHSTPSWPIASGANHEKAPGTLFQGKPAATPPLAINPPPDVLPASPSAAPVPAGSQGTFSRSPGAAATPIPAGTPPPASSASPSNHAGKSNTGGSFGIAILHPRGGLK